MQLFYHQILKMTGYAPLQINPDIAHGILRQNLESDSMWCIFVFEDLLALSSEFYDKISEIWINDPSNTVKGKYRLGVSLEDLLSHDEWTKDIVKLVEESGRGRSVERGFSDIPE